MSNNREVGLCLIGSNYGSSLGTCVLYTIREFWKCEEFTTSNSEMDFVSLEDKGNSVDIVYLDFSPLLGKIGLCGVDCTATRWIFLN